MITLVPSPHSDAMMPAVHHLRKYDKNILVGWHLLPECELPDDFIIYNTEQLKHHKIPDWLKKHEWWEYSDGNLPYYKNMKVRFEPLAQYEIEKPAKVIKSDVLFYGSMNDRRKKIIEELRGKSLDVKVLFGVYEKDLYPYIAGAKIVLDMHFYEQALCNVFRILPALSLGARVISEIPSDNYYYGELKNKVNFTNYENLVEECLKSLN